MDGHPEEIYIGIIIQIRAPLKYLVSSGTDFDSLLYSNCCVTNYEHLKSAL
jgi:hypothetical protein